MNADDNQEIRRIPMFQTLNVPLAQKVGTNTALVAQCLWDEISEDQWADACVLAGRRWIRASYPTLAIMMPYLTKYMVATSIRKLRAHGIIKREKLSKARFDHTSWYAFTPTGEQLMLACENEGCPSEGALR
jgi:hypothetical protein